MDAYTLHQTPASLACALIEMTPLTDGDLVLEAFRGEGAFYDNFPSFVRKEWCEQKLGKDYTEFSETADWVITNPPYRLEDAEGNRTNALWVLLDYFSTRVKKGIAFLINDKCLSTLTPRRLQTLADRGLTMTKLVICSVKKWRGRYYYVMFQKDASPGGIQFLTPNYE